MHEHRNQKSNFNKPVLKIMKLWGKYSFLLDNILNYLSFLRALPQVIVNFLNLNYRVQLNELDRP